MYIKKIKMDKRKHFISLIKKTFILIFFSFSNFAKRRSMMALVTCFIYKGYTTEGVLGFGILKNHRCGKAKP
jgi:hypothetical protein